jgi:hypothetical protein
VTIVLATMGLPAMASLHRKGRLFPIGVFALCSAQQDQRLKILRAPSESAKAKVAPSAPASSSEVAL